MKKDMIKKILSLTLAISMSAAAVTAFADDEDVKDEAETAVEETVEEETTEEATDETVEEAEAEVEEEIEEVEEERQLTEGEKKAYSKLNLLQALGVMTGYSLDDVLENGSITRAEFAEIVIGMYNGKISGGSFDYNDVAASDSFAEAVGKLTTIGVIHGDENNNFNPQTAIKGVEMIKTAVAMLGYDVFAEYRGGYYTGYLNIASERGLSKGINLAGDAEFIDVIEVLYRILDSNTVGFDLNGNIEMMDETFMEHWFDMFEGEGYVSANEYSGVIGTNAAGKDNVVIGGTTYSDRLDAAGEYLGYNVDFWYIDNKSDDPYVVWAEPAGKVTTVTFASEDLDNATSLSLEYDVNGKSKSIRLSEDVTVIYNGVEYSGFTADFFKGINGDFTAVNNGGKNIYDTLVIRDFEYYIVDKSDAEAHTVNDKFGRILKAELDDEADDVIWKDIDGFDYDMSGLQEYDVLAVQKDIDKDTYFKITVFQSYTQGEITGWHQRSGSAYVDLDGEEWKISDFYFDVNHDTYPVIDGTFGDAFVILDMYGNIIMFEVSGSDDYKLGILVKFVEDDGEEKMYAKIYESTSDYTTYPVSDKLKVDGVRVEKNNKYGSAILMLQEGDLIRYVGSGEGQAPTDENFVWQVIRYTVNKDGEINNIDTANHTVKESGDELINVLGVDTTAERGKKFNYKTSGSAFNKLITVGSANVWHLPAPADYANTEAYKIENPNFSNDSSWTIIPYATSYDTLNNPKMIVAINQYKQSLSGAYMFDSMVRVLDDDDNPVTQVTAWHGKDKQILTTEDEHMFDGIEKGDIFALAKNAKGDVDAVRIIFDLSEEQMYSIDDDSKTKTSNPNIVSPMTFVTRYIYAEVYAKSGTAFRLASKFNPVASGGVYGFEVVPAASVDKKDLLELHNMNLFAQYGGAVYNVYEKNIKSATKDDLRAYKTEGSNCSKVFAVTNGGESREMYIYNFEE